jgi:hypothetical protein
MTTPGSSFPARTVHRHEVLRLVDLADPTSTIADADFYGCVLHGPAVLLPMDEVVVKGCVLPDPATSLIELPEGMEVLGVVAVTRCGFYERCVFTNVAFAGTQEILDRFRTSVMDL